MLLNSRRLLEITALQSNMSGMRTRGSGKIKLKNQHRYYEQENLQLNIVKSQKQLNWQPRLSIDESIKQTITWYKNVEEKKISPEKITIKQITNFINENKKNKDN